MLEALHLTKIYKTKGGADVRALDDVSIRFPEKGMVFLLGRSGSGKSTLLNVCSGLDAPTSGEIIVKGRSSKAFSQSDFDSYRNTYVGFIFQEYNILNEFTVEDNIALALELQGKPKDKKVIAKLLEDVDLTGYAKRKPNTLSGGQKQRIAIARALVKSPEIIMADEPTGALDSNTGKQVFDTLKKLSKDKLVIVVSHDRDFAEQYGDRIIELKDGKILSDVTKTQEQQQVITDKVSAVGDTLCIKSGSCLDEEDFLKIKEFLAKTDKDVIIASGERDVKNFKEVSHIKEDGSREVFTQSDESKIEKKTYTPQESRFIRSKLPARHAFKIGVSGLKTKPVRLFFTILLCTVAFVFFGLLSTMTFYDNEAIFKQSLLDSNYSMLQLSKYYQVSETWYVDGEEMGSYEMTDNTKFTDAELKAYADKFGKDAFGGVSVWMDYNVQSSVSDYYTNDIRAIGYLPKGNGLRKNISGRYPEKENEIVISSYTADVIYNCGLLDKKTGKPIEMKSVKDVVGKEITLNGTGYTIVGIMDSGEIPAKYDLLKESGNLNYTLLSQLQQELADGLHLMVFVSEAQFEVLSKENSYSFGMDDFSWRRLVVAAGLGEGNAYIFPEYSNAGYSGFSKNAQESEFIALVAGKTSPADDEVVVSVDMFLETVREAYSKELESVMTGGDEKRADEIADILDYVYLLAQNGENVENQETQKSEFVAYTSEQRNEKLHALMAILQKEAKPLKLSIKFFDDNEQMPFGEQREYTIAGVWNVENGYDKILFSDKTADALWNEQKKNVDYFSEYTSTYQEPKNAKYGLLFVPYDHSIEQTQRYWEIYQDTSFGEDGSRASITSELVSTLEMIDMLVKELSKVFLYVGIVLAIFAALLLSNFISVSISYKKKEIGILRAVGARSIDVFKIFFSESFVITAICVILSAIGSAVICTILNATLASMVGASLFVFGIVSLLTLIAVALVTAIVATFLPVWNAAKKKPVESIRAL